MSNHKKSISVEKIISLINSISDIESMCMNPSILLDTYNPDEWDCDECRSSQKDRDCRRCWINAATIASKQESKG